MVPSTDLTDMHDTKQLSPHDLNDESIEDSISLQVIEDQPCDIHVYISAETQGDTHLNHDNNEDNGKIVDSESIVDDTHTNDHQVNNNNQIDEVLPSTENLPNDVQNNAQFDQTNSRNEQIVSETLLTDSSTNQMLQTEVDDQEIVRPTNMNLQKHSTPAVPFEELPNKNTA